jgi:hypothetical protein
MKLAVKGLGARCWVVRKSPPAPLFQRGEQIQANGLETHPNAVFAVGASIVVQHSLPPLKKGGWGGFTRHLKLTSNRLRPRPPRFHHKPRAAGHRTACIFGLGHSAQISAQPLGRQAKNHAAALV